MKTRLKQNSRREKEAGGGGRDLLSPEVYSQLFCYLRIVSLKLHKSADQRKVVFSIVEMGGGHPLHYIQEFLKSYL